MKKPVVWSFIILVFKYTLVYSNVVIDYTDYAVYRFVCENKGQHEALQQLERNKAVIFMTQTQNIGSGTDIAFAPHLQDSDMLAHYQNMMPWSVITDNLEAMIDREGMEAQLSSVNTLDNDFTFDNYWLLENFYEFTERMIQLNPAICSKKEYGKSSEGNILQALIISDRSQTEDTKPVVLIDSLMHAREWITGAAAAFFANELATNPKHATLLKIFQFVFVLVVNPDGYKYSWTTNRLWRKTRMTNENSLFCKGIDGNRNFKFGFGGAGTSPDPCSDIYPGNFAFQAPEVNGLATLAKSFGKNLFAWCSLHSYSELLLLSYGCLAPNAKQDPEKLAKDEAIADEMIKACNLAHGSTWTWGNSAATLYQACGCSSDYALNQTDCKHAYTLELRDKGNFGFLLPAGQIKPCAEETQAALIVLCEKMIALHAL